MAFKKDGSFLPCTQNQKLSELNEIHQITQEAGIPAFATLIPSV